MFWGAVNPLATTDWQLAVVQPAGSFTTCPLPESDMNTSPAPSTATPKTAPSPLPRATWHALVAHPAGTSTTRLLVWSAMKRSPAPSTANWRGVLISPPDWLATIWVQLTALQPGGTITT